MVKNPPVNAGNAGDMGLGQEDPPEKEMATHSSNPMERGAWQESMQSQRVGHDLETKQQRIYVYLDHLAL